MKMLTIIVPLYNKERYLCEMFDSIFAQKTRYGFDILVADDHSTDRSLEIVREYEVRHPDTITVLRSDTNRKLFKNICRAYERIKTPYFCVLDPDDFWTSEKHIENALDFLESHSDFTIYSSGITCICRDGKRKDVIIADKPRASTLSDYLNGKAAIAFTQSAVYRNSVFRDGIPDRIRNYNSPTKERTFRGDSFRNFIHILEGKAYYSPSIEACYRMTDEGIWAGSSDTDRDLLNAEIFLDFWRYSSYGRLLFRSFRFYQAARRYFNGESLSIAAQSSIKSRMKYLRMAYMKHALVLSVCSCNAAARRLMLTIRGRP